ncbi:Pycsar system effector family protein [Sinomonas cyclohexanicum]|nr:Pycsar system effector family protein [Corynebacterium cyclohexanicum]
MDQVANWVRFADTKATVLTAGLGVVTTMVMTNAKTILDVLKSGGLTALVTTILLSSLAAIAFLWTLFWLVRALEPKSTATHHGINRFAWPTLAEASADEIRRHSEHTQAGEDAWRQVVDLSIIAKRKFRANKMAVRGFALLVITAVALVTTSAAMAAWSPQSPPAQQAKPTMGATAVTTQRD